MGAPLRISALLLLATLSLSACSHGSSTSALPPAAPDFVKSVSPASVSAPPMTQTAILPPSMMASVRVPRSAIQPLGWTQLPGGGIFVAASPDGSLWVLSSIGSGLDRSIWHYVNGNWSNIPGAAMRMSVAPNGTLWVINSVGGIYAYNGASWSTIAGGASDITIGVDGSVYVISNQGGGTYGRGIWRYTNGSWTQMPGAAARIAASWDTGTYPGGVAPGGFWVTNAVGGIYYYNPSTGFNQIPGGVGQVAPTKSGGLFALGYLVNPDGSFPIYYNNLATGSWAQQPGAATSISTDGTSVYVTGAAGGIYKAPISASTTPSAPGVGYLAPTGTGSFAGILNGVSSGVTVVGISTTEVPDLGAPIASGSLAFNVGSTPLGTVRRPASSRPPEPMGPIPDTERPPVSAKHLEALQSTLPGVSGPLQATSYRRTRSLGTTIGSTASFWVTVGAIGSSSSTDVRVSATLRAASTGGYVWVDDSISNIDATALAKIAADLDNAYASDTTHFGTTGFTAGAPGMARGQQTGYSACDNTGARVGTVPLWVVPPDTKVDAFVINSNGLGSGVGGYFTSTNYYYQAAWNCLIGTTPSGGGSPYTAQTIPHSNEAPMIVVGWNSASSVSFETDEDLVRGTAHEMQHLINFVNHVLLHAATASEDPWIDEGMAMLSQDFAVNRKFGLAHDAADAVRHAQTFSANPQNFSLTSFTGIDPGSSSPKFYCSGCYGEAYLFQRYLYDRFGGDAYLSAMLGATTNYAALQAATGVDPHTLISDFAIALAASGTGTTSDPRFTLSSMNLQTAWPDQFSRAFTVGNPTTMPLPSSASLYMGSFGYYALGAGSLNQTLSGKDVGGGFGLQIGVVQR